MKRTYLAIIIVVFVMSVREWMPHPGAQVEALSRSEDEVLYGGARGGGKTDVGIVWMVEPEYITNRYYAGLVIRKNADDLSEWIERAKQMYACLGARFAGKPPIIRFPSGSYIKTGHLKDENAYTKYMGHNYQKILVEELTQIPREKDYLMLISSCRSKYPELPPKIFCTANPRGAGHVWVKKRLVDVAKNKTFYYTVEVFDKEVTKTRIFIPARVNDNPSIMENDPNYLATLYNLPEDLRNAWLYGDWEGDFGQFFDLWNEQMHVIEPIKLNPGWHKYRCLDWGYSAHTACLWIAVDFEGNHYIYREFYQEDNTTELVANSVLSLTNDNERILKTLADPSVWAKNQEGVGKYNEKATRYSIADRLGYYGLTCTKANNDRISGWMRLQELMYWDIATDRKPKIYIFDTCKELIRTIPDMIRDENNPEDLDTDGEDHLVDALRYGVMHTSLAHPAPKKETEIEQIIQRITTPKDLRMSKQEAQKGWDAY